MVIVISGPIASGKSTVARALAKELHRAATASAVIDLDLVYDMLEPNEARKDDARKWRRARHAAAALADAFLDDGVEIVIVEGEFLIAEDRATFLDFLRTSGEPRFVTLCTSFDEALRRVANDPARTFSRDADFLSRHYKEARGPLREAAAAADFVLDTEAIDVDEASRRIAEWALDVDSG
jgi:shikimate kinase